MYRPISVRRRRLSSSCSVREVLFPEAFQHHLHGNAKNFSSALRRPFPGVQDDISLSEIDIENATSRSADIRDIFAHFGQEDDAVSGRLLSACEVVCVTGSRGSGKTTVLASAVDELLSRQPFGGEFIIAVLNCMDMHAADRLSLPEFLFHEIKKAMDPNDIKHGLEWMEKNPSKLIFVLDSVDKLPFKLNGGLSRVSGQKSNSSPAAILFNILDGQLYPGCSFLTSCDEGYMQQLSSVVDVNRVILTGGLSHGAMDRYASSYLNDTGADGPYSKFKTMGPYLTAICEHPTYFRMCLEGLKGRSGVEFLPRAFSGMMINLLTTTLGLENRGPAEDCLHRSVDGLKALAFRLKTSHRECFYCEDVDLSGLGQASRHFSGLPDSRYFQLIASSSAREDSRMRFSHPSIRDALCALHVFEMKMEDFESFAKQFFVDPNYHLVSRCLAGYLFNEGVFTEAMNFLSTEMDKREREKKCNFLKKIVKESLGDDLAFHGQEQFGLFHIIHEGRQELKEIVFNSVHELTIHRWGSVFLRNEDMYALASVAAARVELQELSMVDCNLSSELLESLYKGIQAFNRGTKILKISMALVECPDKRYASEEDELAVSHLLSHAALTLDLSGWVLGQDGRKRLQSKLNMLQILGLEVKLSSAEFLAAESTWREVKEKDISPDGGQIEMYDCAINFPKGSLETTSTVIMELLNDAPAYPEGFLLLTPTINLEFQAMLQKAVDVQLRPWFCSEDHSDLTAEVMHLDDEDQEWTTIDTVDLGDGENISFKCQDFSAVVIAVKEAFYGRFTFPIRGFLYANQGNWCLIFCLDYKTVIREAEANIIRDGFKRVCQPFDPIDARVNNQIRLNLRVEEPRGFVFEYGRDNTLGITKQFIKHNKKRTFQFRLKKETPGSGVFTLGMKYEILVDNEVKDSGLFEHEVQASGKGTGRQKRIEDVFQDDVIPRFTNKTEFAKFARSGDGLSLPLEKVNEIMDENISVSEQKMRILGLWKMNKGDRATPRNIMRVMEAYFARVPRAQKSEELALRDEFEFAMDQLAQHQDWLYFACAPDGLDLPDEMIESIVGNQQNVTRAQKQQMLDQWERMEGDQATAEKLRRLVENFVSD